MYVNVAVLKETHPHERRVTLAPSVVDKLTKLGAKLHMQSGAADTVELTMPRSKMSRSLPIARLWSATPTWFSPCSHLRWM